MDTAKILIELRKQHQLIEDVIRCLERLARGPGRPHGTLSRARESKASQPELAKQASGPVGEHPAPAGKKGSKR